MSFSVHNNYEFITARKRSLGQGNVFIPVCDSVHRGVSAPIACWDTPPLGRHSPPPPNTTGYGQQAGGTHPSYWNAYLL